LQGSDVWLGVSGWRRVGVCLKGGESYILAAKGQIRQWGEWSTVLWQTDGDFLFSLVLTGIAW